MRSTRMRSQRGFTLAEVLVASAIFVVIMVAALTMYDRSNRVFKQSVDATEMQQNARVAYDRMLADIRMAGFDYMRAGFVTAVMQTAPWQSSQPYAVGTVIAPTVPNGYTYRCTTAGTSGSSEPTWPTGNTPVTDGSVVWTQNGGQIFQQPDEQIEYAGTSAITIRANFDYSMNETGDGDHGRETNLESSQFPVVTTGNDEIVTYALVSANASANTGTVSFYADVNNGGTGSRTAYPGGNAERQIQITGVDLTNNNPPYTLYRYTLAPDGSVVATPLANDIRSLTFLYYQDTTASAPLTDTSGTTVNQNVGGDGQYNPATQSTVNEWHRVTRAKIRAIRVRLVGMNGNIDTNYQDTSTANGVLDTAGGLTTDTIGKNYRKMVIDTTVVPRNLGLKGMSNTTIQPPVAPTITSVCVGYCGIAVVNWTPNSNTPNASYIVQWDTSATGNFSNGASAGTANSWAVDLTQQDLTQTYYFRVMAYNSGGSALSAVASGAIQNATVPNPPTSVTASNNVSGQVNLTWSAPTGNASGSPSCTGGATPSNANFIREIQGYRIERDTTSTFPSPTVVVNENTSGPNAPTSDIYGNASWSDTGVQACTTYYYRLRTVEWCAANDADNNPTGANNALSAWSATVSGGIPTSTPKPPTGLTADTTNSNCNAGTNVCRVTLDWNKVTQDTTNNPIAIGSYQVLRTTTEGSDPTVLSSTTFQVNTTNVSIAWQDPTTLPEHDTSNGLKYYYHYSVQATQPGGCPSSTYAGPVQYPPPCSFTGSTVVESGASSGNGTQANPWVMGDGDGIQVIPPVGTTLAVTQMDVYSGSTLITTQTSTTSPANFAWSSSGLTQLTTYSVLLTMTSTSGCTQQITVYVQEELTAGCTLSTGSAALTSGGTRKLSLVLTNSSNQPLTLTSIDVAWTAPNHILWNDVKFPSGGTYSMGGNTTTPRTLTLSPVPAGLTAADVVVPASSSITLTFEYGLTNGNPSIAPADINSICVHYTRPDVINFTFNCRVWPSASSNNPTSCN